jgi:hypothetical protein
MPTKVAGMPCVVYLNDLEVYEKNCCLWYDKPKQNERGIISDTRHIAEMFATFPGRLLMIVDIYADESGTHENKTAKGTEKVATLAGFAAKRETWGRFCFRWNKVLKKYKADFFHYAPWSFAYKSVLAGPKAPARYKDSPYFGLSAKDLLDLRLELAIIAGEGNKLPICGGIDKVGFAALKVPPFPYGADPYLQCINNYFMQCIEEMAIQWPTFKQPNAITMIFDDKKEWESRFASVFRHFQKHDNRFGIRSVANMKNTPPLQAADMLAYRCREMGLEKVQTGHVPLPNTDFDRALFRNVNRSTTIKVRELRGEV